MGLIVPRRGLTAQKTDPYPLFFMRAIWVEPIETQRSWLCDWFPDHILDDLDVKMELQAGPASLSRDQTSQSFTTTFPVTYPQPLKGCGRQVTGPPHEINILVTNSCLHSSSTGLLALSSFITLLSRHTPLSGICTYTLGQNTPNQANLIPKHPFSWPELESGQNEVQSVQFGPKLGKMFEKRAKLF